MVYGFVSGHDFSRAVNGPIKVRALAPDDPLIHSVARPEVVKANKAPRAGKQRSCSEILVFGFVSGHDFSRAVNGPINVRALAPEVPLIHSVARPEVVK